jgi:hypothetical protein
MFANMQTIHKQPSQRIVRQVTKDPSYAGDEIGSIDANSASGVESVRVCVVEDRAGFNDAWAGCGCWEDVWVCGSGGGRRESR